MTAINLPLCHQWVHWQSVWVWTAPGQNVWLEPGERNSAALALLLDVLIDPPFGHDWKWQRNELHNESLFLQDQWIDKFISNFQVTTIKHRWIRSS